ncbi:hypothetical protein N9953_03070 [Akkermansiaceae bacterium]|nr:hypothetical protein [Akkermansiaceae bacterium]
MSLSSRNKWKGGGADALATIESHITSARDQGAMLDDATHRISLGDFDLARSVEQIPKAERYANPLFAENHNRLVELDKHTDCFLPSIDFSAADLPSLSSEIKKAWDVLGVESWPDNSDLKQRISKNKKNCFRSNLEERAPSLDFCDWGLLYHDGHYNRAFDNIRARKKSCRS